MFFGVLLLLTPAYLVKKDGYSSIEEWFMNASLEKIQMMQFAVFSGFSFFFIGAALFYI